MQNLFTQSKQVPGRRVLRVSLAVVGLLAGASFGACGSSDSSTEPASIPNSILDTARVERSIEESILAQRDVHADVSCPSVVPQEEGRNFNCVATVGDTKTVFTVSQTNDHGYVKYHAK